MKTANNTTTNPAQTVTRLSLKDLKERAITSHKAGDLNEAISAYKTCLRINPGEVGIWSNLGAALRKQKHYQSAVNCYRRALALAPDDMAALGNLANVLKDLHRFKEALELHAKVVANSPDTIQSLMNYACALREAGQFEKALQQLDHAKTITPDHAGIEWERSQNLLYLGRYTEGWQAYEARWHTGDLPVRDFPYPQWQGQWQGQPLKGKRLLLHTEQGYGDTILAARYIPLLKEQGAHVTLQCKQALHRLFQRSGADELITTESPDGHPSEPPQNKSFDYHCPLMSLMVALNTQPDTIPPPMQLHIPETAKQKFSALQKQHPGCLKVGIVWSGSITFANNANRSVDLESFLPLAEIPGVRLYSLQKGPREAALSATGADCVIENPGGRCTDFADTAAVITYLDVIVMTDSSVAHLAASMGKPVINLLQHVPYWLYTLEQETTPWYPDMHLIKQAKAGQWDEVFARAYQLIEKLSRQEPGQLNEQQTPC